MWWIYSKWWELFGLGPLGWVIRLRWFGYGEHKDDTGWVKHCMMMDVNGTRWKGHPRKTCLDAVKEAIKVLVCPEMMTQVKNREGTSLRSWLTQTHLENGHWCDVLYGFKVCSHILHLCNRYEEILLQQDPLPAYGLKLLLVLLEQHPAFIRWLNIKLFSDCVMRIWDCS